MVLYFVHGQEDEKLSANPLFWKLLKNKMSQNVRTKKQTTKITKKCLPIKTKTVFKVVFILVVFILDCWTVFVLKVVTPIKIIGKKNPQKTHTGKKTHKNPHYLT